MPNWTKNKMTVVGDKQTLEQFMQSVKSSESAFDFNAIIPMPKSLEVESSSLAKDAYLVYYGTREQQKQGMYCSTDKELDEKIAQVKSNTVSKQLADTYHYNIVNYGASSWYEWRNQNWGTKWNACEVEVNQINDSLYPKHGTHQLDIYFETAWSYPQPVYEKLSGIFPELFFHIELDEEGGFFWGDIEFFNGKMTDNLKEGVRPGGPYDWSDDDE